MHKVRTPWPVATRVQYIAAYEECRRRSIDYIQSRRAGRIA